MFAKDARGASGVRSQCKACVAEYNRQWRSENRERHAEYNRQWYAENRERHAQLNRKWRSENRERHAEYSRQWAAENWQKALLRSCRGNAKKRLAKGRMACGTMELTEAWVDEQLKAQDGRCYWTGLPLELTYGSNSPCQVSIDRIDSELGYTERNCVLVCQFTNQAKRNYDAETFITLMERLAENIYDAPFRANIS